MVGKERNQVVRWLVEDLEIALASAQLTFHVREMVSHKTSLVRLADDFVWFSLRALRDTAVVHLWKVFDTHSRARSLRWFISNASVADAPTRASDLERISTKSSDVKRLEQLRHQIFAHRGEQAVAAGADATLDLHNLTEREFLDLISDGFRILKRHYGTHLSSQLMHDHRNAISQLIDLDVFLEDAIKGDYGLERSVPEVDGRIRGRQLYSDGL